MNAETRVYRRALIVVVASGAAVGALAAGLAGVLAGSETAVAASLGALLGMVVAAVGPWAMVIGQGRTPAGLAAIVATGWVVALGVALTGLALARGLDDERRISLGLTFAAVVLVGLVAKAVVTVKGRVPYVAPRATSPDV